MAGRTIRTFRPAKYCQVAQLVEQRTVNPWVVGSSPTLAARGCSRERMPWMDRQRPATPGGESISSSVPKHTAGSEMHVCKTAYTFAVNIRHVLSLTRGKDRECIPLPMLVFNQISGKYWARVGSNLDSLLCAQQAPNMLMWRNWWRNALIRQRLAVRFRPSTPAVML